LTGERPLVVVQLTRFGIVGVLNTGIHYATFFFLFSFLGAHYLLSSVIGYCFGLLNSYVLNKYWTFRAKTGRRGEFARFTAVNLIALAVNLAALNAFVELAEMRPELAQAFAILCSMAANVTGNKFWTFSPPAHSTQQIRPLR
jgi:putative flippase GtrA